MRFFVDLSVQAPGKTVIAVRAQVIGASGVPIAIGEVRASSASKAVSGALEDVWDALVAAAVEQTREIVAEARRRPAEGEAPGALPEETGPLFKGLERVSS